LFTESAELYDAIYFTFKDYVTEAADIARRLRALQPAARTVLDVGCGTGEHARLLCADHGFEVHGIDLNPEFVRLARAKNPAGQFWQADMADFQLGQQYDAVICMFSAIGYVRTLPRLEQALHSFRRHTRAHGVILVEPWFPPGRLTPGQHSVRRAQQGDLHVERTATTEVDGRVSRLRFEYAIEERGVIRHATETHELGLFTEEETLAAFHAARLTAVHEAPSGTHRGLYIAQLGATADPT
jgi:SAM-dependent methyltransferase